MGVVVHNPVAHCIAYAVAGGGGGADNIDRPEERRRGDIAAGLPHTAAEAGRRRVEGLEHRKVGAAAAAVRSPEEAADSTGPGAVAARRTVEQEAADSNPLAEEGVLRLSVPVARNFVKTLCYSRPYGGYPG